MKLKSFNAETCVNKRATGKSSIGINVKCGLFRINHEACNKLGIGEGSQISLHQDEETPADWYLLASDPKGFEVRSNKSVGKGVVFNKTSLAREIAESVSFDGKSGQILIGAEPIKHDKKTYWPLITTSLIRSV